MGNTSPAPQPEYALQVPCSKQPGCSAVFRDPSHPDELVRRLKDVEHNNTWDCFNRGVSISGNQPALGQRFEQNYRWKTYNEVRTLAIRLGSGLVHLGIVPEVEYPEERYAPGRKMRPLGIFSKNREEWYIAELAAAAFGLTLIPLYDTLGQESLTYILNQARIETVVVGPECGESVLKIVGHDSTLKNVVTMTYIDKGVEKKAKDLGLAVHKWLNVIELGKEKPLPPSPAPPECVNTLCYTSGTTGTPKGVLLTHGMFCALFAGGKRGMIGDSVLEMTKDDIHLSYLPLAHVLERVFSSYVLFNGGRIGLYCGDTTKIIEDIQCLRPTFFLSVPRLYYRIEDRINEGLRRSKAMQAYIFNRFLKHKLDSIHNGRLASNQLVGEKFVFGRFSKLLGGRVRFLACAGAPIRQETLEKISALFSAPVSNGFGMTETCGVAFMSRPGDPTFGHIGGVTPSLEWRVRTLPGSECEYNAERDPPEGELQLRGHSIAPGYFLNEELTRETFLEDGWLCTGDIVRMEGTGKALRVVDRAKSIFKLSQGEYVSPEKIEGVYGKAPLVGQIWVYGESSKNYLVAVVVPCEIAAPNWAARNGMTTNTPMADIVAHPDFPGNLEFSMAEVDQKLQGFERVKRYYISLEPFTVENDLLTPTMKLRRMNLKKTYTPQIDSMYGETEEH